MRFSQALRLVRAMALAPSLVLAQPALARAHPFLPEGDVMDAPRGFVEMCAEDQTFCSTDTVASDPTIITGAVMRRGAVDAERAQAPIGATNVNLFALSNFNREAAPLPGAAEDPKARRRQIAAIDKREKALLDQVNRTVNGNVLQASDMEHFGVPERWQRTGTGPTAVGDCEDIAIEKRIALIDAGFPKDRMFFAVAYIPQIGLHTVLIARTSKGDMVLDNRGNGIRSWHDKPYVWLGVQSVSNPMLWRHIAG